MKLKKPQKHKKEYYDYNECRDYLQKKYNYDERDYAGKYANGGNPDAKYLDFWHWVCENQEVHNGCYIYFSRDMFDGIEEDWVKEILIHYIDEFADKKGELEMYAWW